MPGTIRLQSRRLFSPAPSRCALAVALAVLALPQVHAQQTDAAAAPPATPSAASSTTLETIQVTGSWLGTGLQNSVKNFAGARTLVDKKEIESTGAINIGDALRRIPGVQSTDNSGSAGSAISLNIGVRGLTGRYSPRSTVLLDGIPLGVAPYGQPQISFAPVSLANIESVDVVRGGGAVRYGPQNVGGIINFNTRSIPTTPGLSGDVTVRYNDFTKGSGHNEHYSAFLGTQTDKGLGLALLYSGMAGQEWRDGSKEHVNDVALKFRYELTSTSEVYGKVSYYDVKSRTPGGLTVAQYNANPFQNTRPLDYWNGERKGIDVGYINTISADQEFEIRAFYNDSTRASSLINAANTVLTNQPRDYQVTGIEPRYTQRFRLGPTTQDVTVGYRYIRERGSDNSFTQTVATGGLSALTTNNNETDAHAVYIDDRIAIGAWRITPGIRFEHIESNRVELAANQTYDVKNNKGLPSLNIAYLVNPALTLFTNYTTSYGPVQNLQLNSQSATNPLKPETAKTTELGARWKDAKINAEITAFHMKFDNQIQQIAGSVPAVFQNVGATEHNGIETSFDYTFDRSGPLRGLNLYANYTYTRAIQKSGPTSGLDLPFYSRNTDTIGARYEIAEWAFNLSSVHQSSQYADNANTVAEPAAANNGVIPGVRVWNAQASWKMPGKKGVEVTLGMNNIGDKRYYTRNLDGNPGRMVAAPRTMYVQAKYAF